VGVYYLIVNLDKREFLHPHKFGDGLKLDEFGCASRGTLTALALLLCLNGEPRPDQPLGSWAGDRIAIVAGSDDPYETIYDSCLAEANGWTDVSDRLVPHVEQWAGVKIVGEGWRERTPSHAHRPDA
jgi:hypothetical protein